MNKVIVTTTINPPTEATRKFAQMKGWSMVVAGDRKTPAAEYKGLPCEFFSYEDQEKYHPALSALIGPDCIQRRNMGFLYALNEMQADIVATVDDDNMPYDCWGEDLLINQNVGKVVESEHTIIDPLSVVMLEFWENPNHCQIWHRGFPVGRLGKRDVDIMRGPSRGGEKVFVQADLWDGDPDIDAVCRACYPDKVFFPYFDPFVCRCAPFNSQNTFLARCAMEHYFMHLDVGRWDDIVASFVVQAEGFYPCFSRASVVQTRVGHDVVEDFRRELWGMQNGEEFILETQYNNTPLENYLTPRAFSAFKMYQGAIK